MSMIEQVKSHVDVVTVITQSGVVLKRQGAGWIGRCPFHDDRGRPNLTVDPRGQQWRCWVCGVGGDVLDFVAQWNQSSLAEALGWLRETYDPQSLMDAIPARPEPLPPDTPRAPLPVRHAVYTALLRHCPLSAAHRQALVDRGLSPASTVALGYGSLPAYADRPAIVQALLHDGATLSGVPGFAQDTGTSLWELRGPAGLLIPVREVQGQIQGFQVRADAEGTRRYRWLSTPESDRLHGGASSGVPLHLAGRAGLTSNTVWITEGPLKADVAAHFLHQAVIGVPGVSLWRSVPQWVADWPQRQAVLAFDQDASASTAAQVAEHTHALATRLQTAGWTLYEAHWDAGFKGIDDALLAGAEIVLERWRDG